MTARRKTELVLPVPLLGSNSVLIPNRTWPVKQKPPTRDAIDFSGGEDGIRTYW